MTRRSPGVTLVEILVTMSIFSLLMGVIVLIFREGLTVYRTGAEDVQTFQQSVITMERICREIQDTTVMTLYAPPRDDLMTPHRSQGIVFVKRYPDEGTTDVLGYFFNESTKEIERVVYDPGFDPDDPGTQIPQTRKTMARKVARLSFQGDTTGLMTIEILCDSERQARYLRTKVKSEALLR